MNGLQAHQLQFSNVWLELNASILVIKHLRLGREGAAVAAATAESEGEKTEAAAAAAASRGGVSGCPEASSFLAWNRSARLSSR